MFIRKRARPNDHQLPIRVVCATPNTIQQFGQTMLGQSLQVHDMLFDLEIYVEAQNRSGLGAVYNTAIQMSEHDPAILVFVHDDVCILDWFWHHTLRHSLNTFHIVGLAGTTRRSTNQVSFSTLYVDGFQCEESQYLSGTVAHGTSIPPVSVAAMGAPGQTCKLLDGMFLACDSRVLWKSGLRFDPQFEFHFYDMDFCRQAELLNLIMGTAPISVLHGDGITCSVDNNWYQMHEAYVKKWQQ